MRRRTEPSPRSASLVPPAGSSPTAAFNALLATLPDDRVATDNPLLQRAYRAAARHHAGQRRRDGDPYITHPLAVARTVAALGLDTATICAAMLHDVVEDTGGTLEEIRAEFGEEIAGLVAGAAGFDRSLPAWRRWLEGRRPADRETDRRVLAITLADRLHNLSTSAVLPWPRRRRTAKETVTVLIPLARRFGLHPIRRELHDHAIAILAQDPARLSHRLLAGAAFALPPDARHRWREEWAGELAALPARRDRAIFTAHLLAGLPRLAAALWQPMPRRRRPPR